MPRVLHVGSGLKDIRSLPAFFQDGTWSETRLDIDPAVRPDLVGSMTDMTAVETASVDAIFSSHNIEHLYPHEVPVALAEFSRVLTVSGIVLITCPDLQSVAQLVAEDKLLEPAYQSGMGPIAPLDILYGHRASFAKVNLYMAHHGGFTMRTRAKALTAAGFAGAMAARRPQYFDLWAIGTKQAMAEAELRSFAARVLPI